MNSVGPEPFQKSDFSEPPQDVKLSWGRWLFLGVVSLALCTFLPLVLFAPVPIVMTFLLFGKRRAMMLGSLTMFLLIILSFKYQAAMATAGVYFMSFIYGTIIAEIIFRGVHPIRGLVRAGLAIIFAFLFVGGLFFSLSEVSLTGELEKVVMAYADQIKATQGEVLSNAGHEADMVREFVNNPKAIVTEITNWIPAALVVGVFIGIWASLFVVLRNTLVWKKTQKYDYTLKDLVHFKVSEYLIFPLILGLVLALAGESIIGPMGPVIGGNLLYCIGVFYFFQGFGIFLDFLTHIKVAGFLRTVLVIVGIFMAWRAIVLIGVFDLWVNFRKFLKQKNVNNDDQGEQK